MNKFLLVMLFVFFAPISSNAASIYQDNLITINKKLENTAASNLITLNNNMENTEYDVELLSFLKKETMVQKIQGKASSYHQYSSNNIEEKSYVQFINNDEIDANILLETEMDWRNIKANLKDLNFLYKKIDNWIDSYLSTYIDEIIYINYILTDNNHKKQISDCDLCRKENMLANLHYKKDNYQYIYNASNGNKSSNYNSNLDNAFRSNKEENDTEHNIFSFIYLWEMYSGVIVGVLSMLALLGVIVSLFKFLTRT